MAGEFKVGYVCYPLSSLGIASMDGEIGTFECESDSQITNGQRHNSMVQTTGHRDSRILPKKVIDAAKRIEKEGRPGPKMSVNIRLKLNDK